MKGAAELSRRNPTPRVSKEEYYYINIIYPSRFRTSPAPPHTPALPRHSHVRRTAYRLLFAG